MNIPYNENIIVPIVDKRILVTIDVNYEFNFLFIREFHPLLNQYVSILLDINPYDDLLNWTPVYQSLISAMFSYLIEQNETTITQSNIKSMRDFIIRIESYLNFNDQSKSIETIQYLRHMVADLQYQTYDENNGNEIQQIYNAMSVYVMFEFLPKLRFDLKPILGDELLEDPVVFKYTGNYNGLMLLV